VSGNKAAQRQLMNLVSEEHMQTYFFHVFNTTGDAIDEECTMLADDATARRWAITGIRSTIAEEAKEGRIDMAGRIEITNSAGSVIMTVAFREAFDICLDDRPRN
jgi:hypothetical protein